MLKFFSLCCIFSVPSSRLLHHCF